MRSSGAVVYIVSNDLMKIKIFTGIFRSHGISVVAFNSPAEYAVVRRDDRTACSIFDLPLPEIDGLDSGRQFNDPRVNDPRVNGTGVNDPDALPVIFVAEHADAASCIRAVKNGAIDVLIEPVDQNDLLIAVQTAFAHHQKRRIEYLERASLLTLWQTLTPREMDVFHHTVAGLLNKQAAAELGIAENTYQVHRGRVMKKMKANSLADLVRMSIKLELLSQNNDSKRFWAYSPQSALTGELRPSSLRERLTLFNAGLAASMSSLVTAKRV